MTPNQLEDTYRDRYAGVLVPLAADIKDYLCSCLAHCKRIDSITARAKSIERFLKKAEKIEGGQKKYDDPINQIQDQIGARVITFYVSDVLKIATEVERYFHPIEVKTLLPESDSEFGYFGKHYVLLIPADVIGDDDRERSLHFFELQIKTLFQHAWSEANHDLGYKSHVELTSDQRRKIAFTSAQAWGADQMFELLRSELAEPTEH
jgi:putative GTP pyrophosphokinase